MKKTQLKHKSPLKLAILVPAHNEATVIAKTLQALLKVVDAKDLYVVNDGSRDNTEKVAKKYTQNVLTLMPNKGKAGALNTAIVHFKLSKKYDLVMPMDADTQIAPSFPDEVLPIFEKDTKKKLACVIGKVVGRGTNWVTSYRIWEYEIAQTIHKAAQEKERAIVVCPGCATVFRTSLFDTVSIPTGTLAEDMDLTFLIHRKKLGKIRYHDKAVVVTQDPKTVKDYLKQIDRWYTGFWQCLQKHNIPWGAQPLDAEVAMLATEGLFNGLVVLCMLFIAPLVMIKDPLFFAVPFLLDLGFFLIPTVVFTAYRHKNWKMLQYLPMFYVMRFLSSLVFMKSFIKVVLGFDIRMGWNKATRYKVQEGGVKWLNPSIQ